MTEWVSYDLAEHLSAMRTKAIADGYSELLDFLDGKAALEKESADRLMAELAVQRKGEWAEIQAKWDSDKAFLRRRQRRARLSKKLRHLDPNIVIRQDRIRFPC